MVITPSFEAAERDLAARGISVAKLCRQADVSESTWRRLRQGETGRGQRRTLAKLATAYAALTGAEWPGPVADAREAA